MNRSKYGLFLDRHFQGDYVTIVENKNNIGRIASITADKIIPHKRFPPAYLINESREILKNSNAEWVCTDPDNDQHCRKLSENVFEYRQGDICEIIQYYTFDPKQAIQGFYGSVEEVKELYGDDYKQIIIECEFENNYL